MAAGQLLQLESFHTNYKVLDSSNGRAFFNKPLFLSATNKTCYFLKIFKLCVLLHFSRCSCCHRSPCSGHHLWRCCWMVDTTIDDAQMVLLQDQVVSKDQVSSFFTGFFSLFEILRTTISMQETRPDAAVPAPRMTKTAVTSVSARGRASGPSRRRACALHGAGGTYFRSSWCRMPVSVICLILPGKETARACRLR